MSMTPRAHPVRPAVAVADVIAIAAMVVLAMAHLSCVPDQVMVKTLEDAVCGDGQVDEGEQCDDGNLIDGDGCSAACVTEAGPETECDDGLDNDNDDLIDCADSDCFNVPGCAAICGDGLVGGDEECDDGNNTDGDGCSATCELEVDAETNCEDRVDNDLDGLVDCADPDCDADPFCLCGNGLVDPGEACDDGNNTDGDGCSSSCELE